MNVNIRLENRDVTTLPMVAASGYAFRDGECLRTTDIEHAARKTSSVEDLLHELNGFFWLVKADGVEIIAAVDHVRSKPLFYASTEYGFYLSDDVRWIRAQVNADLDPEAVHEYLHAGFCTGSKTLFKDIYQIQAGESIRVNAREPQREVDTRSYFQYAHRSTRRSDSLEQLADRLEAVLHRSFQRLIEYADGRTLVVPLSGGLDSRLIATTLLECDAPSVIAYSYGRPGNQESEVSARVAEALGIPWHFVPYSQEKWHEWYRTQDRRRFYELPGNTVSVPHLQDWPAVRELKRRDLVPEDAIFVPGHTGDVIVGGRRTYMPDLYAGRMNSRAEIIKEILNFHYVLRDPYESTDTYARLRHCVDRSLEQNISDGASALSAYEHWEWKERQAKYIINSLRTYEQHGYETWLPLWDRDVCEFWLQVPNHVRNEPSFYAGYVQQHYSLHTGETSVQSSGVGKAIAERLRGSTKLRRIKKEVDRWRYKIQGVPDHPLAWYGVLPSDVADVLHDGKTPLRTLIALDRVYGLIDPASKIDAH